MNFFSNLFSKKPAQLPYRLITPRSSDALGVWASHFPDYNEVVGYSSLGHFFLRDTEENDYIVLHPFKGSAKSYGEYPNLNEFESEVLKEPGFQDYVLRVEHVKAIAALLGPLQENEIYIPQPYPFLGGSELPKTYDKGDPWVFAAIVAQMGGL